MKIYMVQRFSGTYCVFSETTMNVSNYGAIEEALVAFYANDTFNPSDPLCPVRYMLNTECTKLYRDDTELFGTVLYEILPPTDTQSYEFW